MKQILTQTEWATKILGVQKEQKGPVRLSCHVLRVPCPQGELWYHNMTGEMLLFGPEERPEEYRDELVRRWYLVAEDSDEYTLAMQLRRIAELMARKTDALTKFVVFPTTDCNARCFYCYEMGRSRQHMSDTVAADTAEFILRRSKGHKIELQWFGGEPLYHRRAIDIISRRLREQGAEYRSIMVSNGYLFDEGTVRAAVEDWHLDFVQIALDGCEATYNRTKTYIHHDGNAFERVMHNISLLLDAGIKVCVRMNMNLENADELWRLSDQLKDRFGAKSGFTAYTVLLRDFHHGAQRFGDEMKSLRRYEALQKKLIADGLGKLQYTRREIPTNQCMADNDRSVTILPDGRVGKCEHESEERLIGTIYDETFDQTAVSAWKERIVIPECRTCLLAPTCIRLKQCAWHAEGCTESNRTEMRMNLTQKVLNTYERECVQGEKTLAEGEDSL